MLASLVVTACLTAGPVISPDAHETQQLLEQYDQNAQHCGDVACIADELDGIDIQLLMGLGRRAAVLRQHGRILAESKRKRHQIVPSDAAARRVWLNEKAQELGVPKVFASPIVEALIRASDIYAMQAPKGP